MSIHVFTDDSKVMFRNVSVKGKLLMREDVDARLIIGICWTVEKDDYFVGVVIKK